MKILHVLKTSTGGDWAARQVAELVNRKFDVHVVLPTDTGSTIDLWKKSGAQLHFANLDFPVKKPWLLFERLLNARKLIQEITPDIIHSHFVSTTLTLRVALGKNHPTPRFFQVPGPLHMENAFFRTMEIATAGASDYWIASSAYIYELYKRAGITPERIFLSYYGMSLMQKHIESPSAGLREKLNIDKNCKIITNVSYMYPPKYYLGQSTGLKCHEDLIDALGMVSQERDIVGVFVGSQWGHKTDYEEQLKKRAAKIARDRIRFLGRLSSSEISSIWAESDLAVHVPRSENCGGVVEPLLSRVPVIASKVGGIPEVIFDQKTGYLVPPRDPKALAKKICEVLDELPTAKLYAEQGNKKIYDMFDIVKNVDAVVMAYEKALSSKGYEK